MSGTGEVKETKGGRWDKNRQGSKELRQPKSKPDVEATSNENNAEVNSQEPASSELPSSHETQNHTVLNSTLNANAQEFVPKSSSFQSHNNENRGSGNDIINHVKSELNLLTCNPGRYEEMVGPMGDALSPYLNNESVIREVVDTIVDECISESNLRYNGARLCCDLVKRFGSLRTPLLERCQKEHNSIIQGNYPNEPSLPERLGGFTMLLAELFLQLQSGGSPIKTIGVGLLDLLEVILSCEIDNRIKHVCQIFKLAGALLEELGDPKLEEVFNRLKKISTYPDLDPNLRFLIQSVLNMRASNWGNCRSQQSAVPASTDSNSDCYQNDPVFYGPDGQVISEEESCFLQENVPLSEDVDDYLCDQDSMDEEVYNAFEQFLQMNEQKKNHQNHQKAND